MSRFVEWKLVAHASTIPAVAVVSYGGTMWSPGLTPARSSAASDASPGVEPTSVAGGSPGGGSV